MYSFMARATMFRCPCLVHEQFACFILKYVTDSHWIQNISYRSSPNAVSAESGSSSLHHEGISITNRLALGTTKARAREFDYLANIRDPVEVEIAVDELCQITELKWLVENGGPVYIHIEIFIDISLYAKA